MTTSKCVRGRPRGTGKNDRAPLAQVADLMVRDASLKATTAMRRVMRSRRDWGASDDTLLRRWQVKWKQDGDAFLAAARERVRPSRSIQEVCEDASAVMLSFQCGLAEALRSPEYQRLSENLLGMKSQIEQWTRSPEVQRAIEAVGAYQRQIAEATRSPGFLRGLEELRRADSQIKQMICKPEFQRAIEGMTAFQRQYEHTRLPAFVVDYGKRV